MKWRRTFPIFGDLVFVRDDGVVVGRIEKNVWWLWEVVVWKKGPYGTLREHSYPEAFIDRKLAMGFVERKLAEEG